MMTPETDSIELESMPFDALLSELRQRQVSLWLEGDRLRYRAAKDAMTPALLAQMKTHKAAIITFLQQATALASAQLPPIVALDRSQDLPLSFAQQRFWSLHQFEPNSAANNMPVVVRCTGTLDVAALERSLQEVVRRHEVLRATFPVTAGKPTQTIVAIPVIPLPMIDLAALPADQREAEAYRLATEEAHRGFDFAQGPILRALLLRLSQQQHLLLWNMPCMVCDGASSDVFYQDLTAIYGAFSAGQPSPLAELPIQYADFAHWQRQWLQGEVLETQLNYWKQKLAGKLSSIHLPYDRPRPLTVQTARGDRGAQMLPKSLNDALTALSQKLGVTLFMTLLAVFEILLYRYSQQADMLISFASAGRGQVETERLLGFFSNTLILRTNFTGNPTFREVLDRVRQASLEAYTHQDLPFEKLLEELQPEQSLLPLFQVKFALNPPWSKGRGMAAVELPDLTFKSLFGYIYHGSTKYDLTLVMREQDEGLGMVFDYNAELFDASTIARMLGHFKTLLEGIVANPDQLIAELPLLTAAEQAQFQRWNETAIEPPEPISIPQAFAAQVERTPEAIAVEFKDAHLTYRELDVRANQLAYYLQALGVQIGDRVGLGLDRSVDRIAALLGILKAGGAYVPFEAGQPQGDRWFKQSQTAYLLTHSVLMPQLPELPESMRVVCLDVVTNEIAAQSQTAPTPFLTADSLAYIAGETPDCPTSIGISHRGVIQSAQSLTGVTLDPTAVVLQLASLSTGIAAWEIWACLLNGGKLVIAPPGLVDAATLGMMIRQSQITTLWLPPRWINRLVDQQLGDLKSVRHLLTGGDVISLTHLQKLQQHCGTCQLMNVYTPADMLPIAAYYPLADLTQSTVPTPIGYPIANTQLYVLDHHLQPLPVGVTGELYVCGNGWMPDRQDRLAEAWITSPFTGTNRLYRTGDLARYLPDGSLARLGRSDQIFTIRDFPVSAPQVETVLARHPALREVFVGVEPAVTGDAQLVAYVLPHPGQLVTPSQLSGFLKPQLPLYMVPSAFVKLETLPLTPQGWVNRHGLPIPDDDAKLLSVTENAGDCRDELDFQLTQIWEAVLGIQGIGIQDNFFDRGGHSLLAVQLFAQIEATFSTQFMLSTLLAAPTIAQQAELIRARGATGKDLLVPLQHGNANTPALFCLYSILLYRDLAQHMGPEQTVHGLYLQEEVDLLLNTDQHSSQPFISIQQIAERYLQKIRTIQPAGPYLLLGLSFGGLIAYEMAQQLHAQGEQVSLLALLDTQTPDSNLKVPWYHRGYIHLLDLLNKGPAYFFDRLRHKTIHFQQIFGHGEPTTLSRPTPDPRIQFRRQAARGYVLSPYPGRITLFRAMETVSKFESTAVDPTLGWGNLAVGGLAIHDIPGNHLSILQKPNVSVLASKLKVCIQEVQEKV
jgi:non-ribosomal peptide synthetase component F/thioesterase domain-containing protein